MLRLGSVWLVLLRILSTRKPPGWLSFKWSKYFYHYFNSDVFLISIQKRLALSTIWRAKCLRIFFARLLFVLISRDHSFEEAGTLSFITLFWIPGSFFQNRSLLSGGSVQILLTSAAKTTILYLQELNCVMVGVSFYEAKVPFSSSICAYWVLRNSELECILHCWRQPKLMLWWLKRVWPASEFQNNEKSRSTWRKVTPEFFKCLKL